MIRPAALLILLAGCTSTPPTYGDRLNLARERLGRLASDQWKATPADDRLLLLAAALQGSQASALDDAPRPTPLLAVLACTWTLRQLPGVRFVAPETKEADEVLAMIRAAAPTSSFGPLFRARRLLLDARKKPDFWIPLTTELEDALRLDSWHCPVRDFNLWLHDWLAKHEPDLFVRASLDFNVANLARSVLLDLRDLVVGAAFAPGAPRAELAKLAALARRLAERFAVDGEDLLDFLIGQAALDGLHSAEFLLAWRSGDLEEARRAADRLDEHARRAAAFDAYKPEYMKTFEIKTFLLSKALERAFQPMLDNLREGRKSPDETPERVRERMKSTAADEELLAEAARRIEAGASDYLATERAALARRTSFFSTFADRSPAVSSRRNYLTIALRDRSLLLAGAFPENRLKDLLDAAFEPDLLLTGGSVGSSAYSWIVLDALRRPDTTPGEVVDIRFRGDRAENMDVAAILRARGRPVPQDIQGVARRVRDFPYPEVLHGYCLVLQDLARTRPTAAADWLLPAEGEVPGAAEIMIAESLRAATGLDWGPDWPRWQARFR